MSDEQRVLADDELRFKEQLSAVDRAMFETDKAVREQEMELARIESTRVSEAREYAAQETERRRRWRGYFWGWTAAVIVTLAVVVALWAWARNNTANHLREEQLRQQTAQECIRAGNLWVGGDCLISARPQPAGGAR